MLPQWQWLVVVVVVCFALLNANINYCLLYTKSIWFETGPSVLAITSGAKGDIYSQKNNERMERKVADSMIAAAKAIGVTGRVFLTNPTTIGAHVVA